MHKCPTCGKKTGTALSPAQASALKILKATDHPMSYCEAREAVKNDCGEYLYHSQLSGLMKRGLIGYAAREEGQVCT